MDDSKLKKVLSNTLTLDLPASDLRSFLPGGGGLLDIRSWEQGGLWMIFFNSSHIVCVRCRFMPIFESLS